MNNKIGWLMLALVLAVASITIAAFVLDDRGVFDEVVEVEEAVDIPADEGVEEAPPQRQWSGYMQEWLQTNRLVIDYLNVKEKEWCAVAIQRIAPPDPEHPGAIPVEPTIDCIN